MSTDVILGAGIAGISAGYHLKRAGRPCVLYEKDADWGGLCGNFTVGGFRFDRFVHLSFAPEAEMRALFAGHSGLIEHVPFPVNWYHGRWLRHPAQQCLAPLSPEEKADIVASFISRPRPEPRSVKRYDEWLRAQYGSCFAERFPFAYTRKYWGVEAAELETRWVGVRMTSPDLKEVLLGSYQEREDCLYYAKKMYYPRKGGFRSILDTCREGLDIRFGRRAVHIDPQARRVDFADGTSAAYGRLVTTAPLPETMRMLDGVPQDVREAAAGLRHTCGMLVSLGLRRPQTSRHLWFYIYDEDIPPARVYAPDLKSPDNVPPGCSALQAEVFWDSRSPRPDPDDVRDRTVDALVRMGLFTRADIAVCDVRFEPYANVTFVPDIYEKRERVLRYLDSLGIRSIGRFGTWDYKWTHQAFADGRDVL